MGIFGNGETREAKSDRKIAELLAKYGVDELSDPRDIASVREIAQEMAGNKLIEAGTLLQGNGIDATKMAYLRILMQQNFIIIRQLDKLNSRS